LHCDALQADWELTTWLSLPWKPYVQIQGKTVYTLNAHANKVCSGLTCHSCTAAQLALSKKY